MLMKLKLWGIIMIVLMIVMKNVNVLQLES